MSERGRRSEPEGPWSNEFMHAREAVVAGIQSEIQTVRRRAEVETHSLGGLL